MSNLLKKEKGFTLIEIVLVLAIAGLLLVIVFLAVSGAQKARRDSARKNDAARMASQVEGYAGNNNGNIPTLAQVNTATTGVVATGSSYFNTTSQLDPSGATYVVTNNAPAAAGDVRYQTSTFCPGVAGTAGARNYALTIYIEQGGTYCVDNH